MIPSRIPPFTLLLLLVLFLASCTLSASDAPSQVDLPTPTTSPALEQIPYPLLLSNTWVYQHTAYTDDHKATWRITESVVDHLEQYGLLIATVERRVKLESGNSADIINPPQDEIFRYILKSGHLYRQTGALDLVMLEQNATLELVFPLENQPCWMVSPGFAPDTSIGCRRVDARLESFATPAGEFSNCLALLTPYNNGGIQHAFCPGIGFVQGQYDHVGTPYGYEFQLIGYSLSETGNQPPKP